MPVLLHLRQVSVLRLCARLRQSHPTAQLRAACRHSCRSSSRLRRIPMDSLAVQAAGVSSRQEKAVPPKPAKQLAHYCRMCGGSLELAIPEGDDHWRLVCSSCGYVDFQNPKMVVGCIVEHEGKVLLARRAIEPCKGKWTIPAGFLEMGESTAEGAARETWEEAEAKVEILAPFAHYDIPRIGQAYLIFRARLAAPFTHAPGQESLETRLVAPQDVPWDEIAFSSISLSLRAYLADRQQETWHFTQAVIDKKEGSPPNDPDSYILRDQLKMPGDAARISSRL